MTDSPDNLIVSIQREPKSSYLRTITVRRMEAKPGEFLWVSHTIHGHESAQREGLLMCKLVSELIPDATIQQEGFDHHD